MQTDYKKIFSKNSLLAVNMSDDLLDESVKDNNSCFILTYTGSLYYGRGDILAELAKCIEKYNDSHEKKAFLEIYCSTKPKDEILKKINIRDCSKYMGCLDRSELKQQLNKSNILVFVESFEKEQREKTRYSLSTKIPEYMSVAKPILAIGPAEVGSMIYLKDVALCVSNLNKLYSDFERLLENKNDCKNYSSLARNKYEDNHNKEKLQYNFVKNVMGF